MNWQKVLLVLVGLVVAFVLLVTAALGLAAVAGVVAVAESGVLDSISVTVDEAVAGADQVRVQVDVPEITVTDGGRGRAHITAQGENGRFEFNVDGPGVTVTDLESGEIRRVVPRLDSRIDRFEVDGFEFQTRDHAIFWPHGILSPLFFLVRGFFVLVAIGMIAAGVIILRRNRQAPPKKEKTV
jgi:hypothetical protein